MHSYWQSLAGAPDALVFVAPLTAGMWAAVRLTS